MNMFDELKDIESNSTQYDDVPTGTYEVALNKLELGKTQKGDDKISAWLHIKGGEYDGRLLFNNRVVKSGYTLHLAKEFLKSLKTGVQVEFNNMAELEQVLDDIYTASKDYTYELHYNNDGKWPEFTIKKQFGGDDVWEG